MAFLQASKFKLIADGLGYPESPVYLPDGSILLVEIKGQCLTRVAPDGSIKERIDVPGGPNGCAFGPDGNIYIANSGGFKWQGITVEKKPIVFGIEQASDYAGGKIERIDLATKKVTIVYHDCQKGTSPAPALKEIDLSPPVQLRGPDDLVFDENGNFWCPDFGKVRARDRDVTGIFYGNHDGSSIREMIFPLPSPNGIALSPDGMRVYTSLTYSRQILYWELESAGTSKIKPNPATMDGSYCLTANLPEQSILDSMAVDSDGNVYVMTMLPDGMTPLANGGISIISPDGKNIDNIEIKIPGYHSPLPSSLCFGGADMRTLYVTCGAAGLLATVQVHIPGLKLNFNKYDLKNDDSKR